MEKLAENDLTYFYLRHVVIVVTAVTTISLTPVINEKIAVGNLRKIIVTPKEDLYIIIYNLAAE
jgi:hypothetical protein